MDERDELALRVAEALMTGGASLSEALIRQSYDVAGALLAGAWHARVKAEARAEGLEQAAGIAEPPLAHRKGKVGLWRQRRAAIAAAIRAAKGTSDEG